MTRPALLAAAVTAVAFTVAAAAPAQQQAVPVLRPDVLASFPHDPRAFTQGLLVTGGALYESTGLYGRSEVRRVELETGRVLRRWRFPRAHFGEGLATVGDRLVALTWRESTAHVLGRATLRPRRTFRYQGEGWGLCHNGRALAMSNGSAQIAFRDPATFRIVRRITVRLPGSEPVLGLAPGPVQNVNELECVGTSIYANIWLTDVILRIDAASGIVQQAIDASGLLGEAQARGADVLNGIAALGEGEFLLTGKLWPRLFRVRFV